MKTNIDNLWVLALASNDKPYIYTLINLLVFFMVFVLGWFIRALLSWSHPGGPAWGNYHRNSPSSSQSDIVIPGPRGFPIIGSMSLMIGLAHHKIAGMAKACGGHRLMAFSLGETRVIVTCNPDVAKEILNSSVFADRPVKESAYSLMFNRAIGFAPYGVYWQTLRKIAATHLFCPKQISMSALQRFEIAQQMVTTISCNNNESDQLYSQTHAFKNVRISLVSTSLGMLFKQVS